MAGYPPADGGLGPIAPAPGLGQAPGLTRSGPPGEAPPPPPPGMAHSSYGYGAVGEGRAQHAKPDVQKEISGTIETQVQRLIEQARQDTEAKVKNELKQMRETMMAVDARLDKMIAQLDSIEPQEPAEPALDGETVANLLSKIEQQWGQEIRTLKQELHQTILAHNHNADLIKHHKDTIDSFRERCQKLQSSSVKTSEIQQQLKKMDDKLKAQQKQRKLEPLFQRLTELEQRVATAAAAAAQSAAWRYSAGMPPVGMMPPMGAPGMLPPGVGGKGAKGCLGSSGATAPTAQGKASATGEKGGAMAQAAYKRPTDEEVQARLSKLTQSSEAHGLPQEAGDA